MNVRPHRYDAHLRWTGARNGATVDYQTYSREYVLDIAGKPALTGSADVHFRGDAALHNPEDLLVGALSACHLLSYLAECARAGIAVVSYVDEAYGEMTLIAGKMRFREVVLQPRVVVAAGSDLDAARRMHERAHEGCFIANSVNFPVRHAAEVHAAAPA